MTLPVQVSRRLAGQDASAHKKVTLFLREPPVALCRWHNRTATLSNGNGLAQAEHGKDSVSH